MPKKRARIALVTSLLRRCHAQSRPFLDQKMRLWPKSCAPKVPWRYLSRFQRYSRKTIFPKARGALFAPFTPWPPLPPALRFFIHIWHFVIIDAKKRICRIRLVVSEIPTFGGSKNLSHEYKDSCLINTPLSNSYNIKPPPIIGEEKKMGEWKRRGRGEWCEPASVFCVVTREVVPISKRHISEFWLYSKNVLSPLLIHPSPHLLPLTLSHNIQTVPLPRPVSRIDKYPFAMRTPLEPAICL